MSVALGSVAAAQGVRLNGPLARPLGGDVLSARLTPDGSRAVYVADQLQDDVFELFAAPTDGSQAFVRLSGALTQGLSLQPASVRLSADGARVLYFVGDGVGLEEPWSARTNGSAPAVQLAPAAYAATFTPDGSQVLFTAELLTTFVGELFRESSDGGAAVRVSAPPLTNGDVHFGGEPCALTPDGTRVVYVADHEVLFRTELYSVPLDGSEPAVKLNGALVSGGQVQGTDPSAPMRISPDGTRVVYRADQDVNERYELYGAPIDGSSPAVKLSGSSIGQGDVQGGFGPSGAVMPDFRLTPDGARVVFRADRVADNVFALFQAPIDGSPPPLALSSPGLGSRSAYEYEVSPDSSRVVFTSDPRTANEFELFSASLETSLPPLRLSAPLVAGGDVAGDFAPAFAFSADSRWVVYRADQEVDGQFELFRVPLDGHRFVRRAGGAPPPSVARKLSPPLVGGADVGAFALDASGARVVLDANDALYGVALAGAAAPQRLDGLGGAVLPGNFALAAAAARVAYLAEGPSHVSELFAAPTDASAPAVRLNGDMPLGPVLGDVLDFALAADGRHVVFVADGEQDDLFELYSTRTTGRAPVVKLATAAAFRIHPAGAEVLYAAEQESLVAVAPYAEPIEGGAPRLVGGPFPVHSFVEDLDLSADGVHVVYTATAQNPAVLGLFGAPFDGSAGHVELSSAGGQHPFVERFVLAPTSDRVAFVTRDAFPDHTLHSAPLDHSSEAVALSTPAQGVVTLVSFTPDGQRVVFLTQSGTLGSLYSAPADGSQPAVRLGGPSQNGQFGDIVFAPDSSRVVWIERISSFRQLRSAPVDGSASSVLLWTESAPGSGLLSPRVTADSSRVAFLAGLPPELRITPIGASGALSLSGAGNLAPAFDLTPDGASAVYWGDAPGLGRGILRVPLDASAPPVRLGAAFTPFTYGEVHALPGGPVVFTVDATSLDPKGLYAVPLDGGAPWHRLHRAFAPDAGLSSPFSGPRFEVSADSSRVVYRAFLSDFTRVDELFLSFLERAPLPGD